MKIFSKKIGGGSALGLALGAAMLVAQPVAAAVFDFGELANGNEGTWESRSGVGPNGNGTFDNLNDKWTVDSIGVVATASNTSGDATIQAASKAYLDSYSSSKPAGLGVCSTVSVTSCGNASDDNTGIAGDDTPLTGAPREILKLTFDTEVAITSLTFNNRDHDPLNNNVFEVSINGVVGTASSLLSGSLTGMMFTFERLANGTKAAGDRDFYLNAMTVSQVPLPAGVLLLGSALGGLGLMKRRRKAA